MRKEARPGILIGAMFLVATVVFGSLIFAATRPPPSTPVAPTSSAPSQDVSSPTRGPAIDLTALDRSTSETYFFVDKINDVSLVVPPPMPITINSHGDIALTGWAVDTAAGSVAGGVIVAVDDKMTFQAAYGIDRPDVATALKSDTYRRCGFRAILPAGSITPGRHTITIKIVAANLRSYYAPAQAIDVQVV